jgi:hypothetical protein
MSIRLSIVLFLLLCLPCDATAQHGAGPPAPATGAPAAARQFDFLVGQWEVEAKPKVSGLVALIHGAPKLVGSWKAWRGFDGFGIEDELRIVDASGNPLSLNHALRLFDRNQNRWTVVNVDVYRAKVSNSSAQWDGSQMRIEGSGVDGEGKAYRSRTRYFDVAADAFRMQQDRSYDDGKTWDEGTLTIDAHRIAASASR